MFDLLTIVSEKFLLRISLKLCSNSILVLKFAKYDATIIFNILLFFTLIISPKFGEISQFTPKLKPKETE